MCLAIEEMRLESEKIGEWRGERRGEERGEKRGISRINRLNSILLQQGRLEDLKRAIQEPEYQEALIEELLLDGYSGWYAPDKVSPGLRDSDVETLSLQKSVKSRDKNTDSCELRVLHLCLSSKHNLYY